LNYQEKQRWTTADPAGNLAALPGAG